MDIEELRQAIAATDPAALLVSPRVLRRVLQAEFQVPYPDGLDSQAGYLRYGVTGPPETYFIDARGVVRHRYAGPLDAATLGRYLAGITS